MQKKELHNSALKPITVLLGYEEMAKRLGIPKSTLADKIKAFNAVAGQLGMDRIVPDEVQPTTTTKHLYNPERVPEIKKALAALTTRGRGRPRKGDTPS